MTFWLSYSEALAYFKVLSVCRIGNWHEARLKGKFVRIQDYENSSIEQVMSKWYYSFTVTKEHTRLFIAVHQEDERINGVLLRRPYLDVGIALLRRTKHDVELVDMKDFETDR